MTTFIAWLALAVSTTSLVWQMLSWWRSGAHVKVEGTALGFGSKTYVHFHLVNRGRSAATVSEIGWHAMSRQRRWPVKWSLEYSETTDVDEKLPLRLEGQADFEAEIPIYNRTNLSNLLDDHPDWRVFPWARVGGRGKYGRHLHDEYFEIRQRLEGHPTPPSSS